MKIGLTYDLRQAYLAKGYSEEETAEFDRLDTIESLAEALESLGHKADPIGNAEELIGRLACGDRWDLVFNIAEGLKGIGREAQIPAILDVYGIPYTFSDPLVMALSLHKGMTKRVVRDAGLATPEFHEIYTIEDAGRVTFEPPYFIKPVAEGTGKGITENSVIYQPEQLDHVCRFLLEKYTPPLIVERFLPGREFTVGIIGTGSDAEVVGTLEIILLSCAEKNVYSYVNKERCEELVEYRLVKADMSPVIADAEALALSVWRVLGCRDGGRVDIRCDENSAPSFIEVNPLAGLHPEHSDLPILCSKLGIPYITLIDRILTSAIKRVKTGPELQEVIHADSCCL
ncbi:MAG: ATP-grasp domain-containing protein [Desulfobacterales bacterium]|nr:ATP-grasp domain-containing protein [Desulfobacterales bacterium]